MAFEALDHVLRAEILADMAEAAMSVELLAVEGDDAGGFLAAMLQGVEAERREGGGFRMAENAEDAAFLMRVVVIERNGIEHRPRLGHGVAGLALKVGIATWKRQPFSPGATFGARVNDLRGGQGSFLFERGEVDFYRVRPYPLPMAEPSENLVLELLRAIPGDIGELKDDMREVKSRLGTLEEQSASLSRRIDRLDDRIARIERRLELTPTP
jgi:hypothetical protein